MHLKIVHLRLQVHLPGANELIWTKYYVLQFCVIEKVCEKWPDFYNSLCLHNQSS